LIAACSLNPNDYYHINVVPKSYGPGAYDAAALMAKFPTVGAPVELSNLSTMVDEDLGGRSGGAVTLAVGMAAIFTKLPLMGGLMSFWYHFAIVFEAMFILTTIDTGTRVARFILQELLGAVYKPLGRTNWLPGVIGTSAFISFCWGYLIFDKGIDTIWPMFGVANQLLGVLSLAIGTTLLLRYAPKRKYALVAFLPFCVLSVTVMVGGLMNITHLYLPKSDWVPLALTAAMLALVLIVIADSFIQWSKLLGKPAPQPRPVFGADIVAEAA
jgi:carbon starvation protein